MSTGTTDADGIVALTEYTHDGYLVDEIDRVDLSNLQLDDNDDWLYMPPQCSIESTVDDIYTWLKTEPDKNSRNNKKYIDTRTFTRPKKRSARMSFESIFEGLSPSMANTWRLQNTDHKYTGNGKCLPVTIIDKESVPPILKPSVKAAMNILSDENSVISGPESMEAFLNMSQSKGIDSFINLGEPEFNDLLMNVSQPSIWYTSVISSVNESIVTNDTIQMTNKNTAQNSNDVEETSRSNSFNKTFVRQDADNTITPDKMCRTNSLSETICKKSIELDKALNVTYSAETSSETSASQSSLDKGETTGLFSTIAIEPKADATFVQSQNEAIDVKSLDTTYLSSVRDSERRHSPVLTRNDTYKVTTHEDNTDLNVTRSIPLNGTESTEENAIDISFKVPIYHQSTPINQNVLNPMSKLATRHLDQPRQDAYPTTRVPTSLRRELLAEIQRSEGKLDSTYNHISDDRPDLRDTKENIHAACNENYTDAPPSNRYHTYRKSTLTTMANQCRSQRESAANAQKKSPVDQRKFYTFTKRNNNPVEKTDNTANGNTDTRLNMDGTFCKPLPPKAQQKRNVPRMLSKLPQFLQKSNPNLVSNSLKGVSSYASISSVGNMKGSQPNIVQNIAERSQLPSKLHPYGKLKSGSEQRLLEVNVNANSQFPMKDVTAAGSTESIESTQSIHSAPDLDDRLSTCSDSSSHQCTRHMNIEQLHQLVRMQEESLKHDSAPKPNRQVLENTWIEEKRNLPSPILKVQHDETDRHSLNIDLSMKCSSPLMSPTGSSHALNNDGNAEGNVANTKDKVAVVEKTEGPNQVVPKVENKTRLRQPTNWTSGSKPAAVISGIPRPASRIPALRFVRPSAKTTQADLRKGCT